MNNNQRKYIETNILVESIRDMLCYLTFPEDDTELIELMQDVRDALLKAENHCYGKIEENT